MLKIILDETFCDMIVIDMIRNRKGKVFEDVVENLVALYNEEEVNLWHIGKIESESFLLQGPLKTFIAKFFN